MLIKVMAYPNSKNAEVVKKAEDSYDVYVREKAQRGEATRAIASLLAIYFEVPLEKMRLVKGFKEPHKIFEIPD